MNGKFGALHVKFPARKQTYYLWLTLKGRVSNDEGKNLVVDLFIDGNYARQFSVSPDFSDYVVELEHFGPRQLLDVSFVLSHAEEVWDQGILTDDRKIGMQLGKVGFITSAFLNERENEGLPISIMKKPSRFGVTSAQLLRVDERANNKLNEKEES
jgi:hypothetical protein